MKQTISIVTVLNCSPQMSGGHRLQDSVMSPSSPYEFLKVWESLEDPNLMSHARLLRGLEPSDLTIVLGNKLDGNMLRTILTCLEQHFLTRREDGQLALQYLQALSKAERFSVVIMFLTDKEVIQNLFGRLESLGLEPSKELKNMLAAFLHPTVLQPIGGI
uniref:RNA-polymerase II-associated protein 3-like C-terminal domain-containing protein n=2 Tax=Timema TaxID=61471 RepID=A0A7R9EII7_9NEOP|nr:unnamed protein product [Timema monikensis]